MSKTRTELLNEKLPGDVVMTRIQGGAEVSYVGGWTVIENANRIFGYQGWEFQLGELTQVEFSEVTDKSGTKKGWRIAYIATGRVNIFYEGEKFSAIAEKGTNDSHTVEFSDVGFGNAVSYQSIGDAIESATKEAATDCMKRCLRFMGNQFGLALYDKQQRNVDRSTPQSKLREYVVDLNDEVKQEASRNAIASFCSASKKTTIDQLTAAQCNELFDIIKQLNEGGVNEYAKAKKE